MTTLSTAPIADRNALILCYMDVARRMARAMARQVRVDVEDFVQDAMLALTELAGDFDPSRDIPFDAYLKTWLRFRLLQRRRRLDHYSEAGRRRVQTYAAANTALAHDLMREPTTPEIAVHLGWTIADVGDVLRRIELRAVSFELLADWVPARVDVEATVLESLAIEEIELAVAQLGARDREIVAALFAGEKQRAIARRLGCSPQRVSQCVSRIRAATAAHLA